MPNLPLPTRYGWLADEPGPRILTEFLKVYGVAETQGEGNTVEILRSGQRSLDWSACTE